MDVQFKIQLASSIKPLVQKEMNAFGYNHSPQKTNKFHKIVVSEYIIIIKDNYLIVIMKPWYEESIYK